MNQRTANDMHTIRNPSYRRTNSFHEACSSHIFPYYKNIRQAFQRRWMAARFPTWFKYYAAGGLLSNGSRVLSEGGKLVGSSASPWSAWGEGSTGVSAAWYAAPGLAGSSSAVVVRVEVDAVGIAVSGDRQTGQSRFVDLECDVSTYSCKQLRWSMWPTREQEGRLT